MITVHWMWQLSGIKMWQLSGINMSTLIPKLLVRKDSGLTWYQSLKGNGSVDGTDGSHRLIGGFESPLEILSGFTRAFSDSGRLTYSTGDKTSQILHLKSIQWLFCDIVLASFAPWLFFFIPSDALDSTIWHHYFELDPRVPSEDLESHILVCTVSRWPYLL